MKKIKIVSLLIFGIITMLLTSCSKDSKNAPENGKSGSTARMITVGNYIYAIDNNSLKVIDITIADNPKFVSTVDVGFGIETIYPFKNYLMIGSTTGMFIFSLAQPDLPVKLSNFNHATACDPVIANDSLAFVTLHYNESCHGLNQVRQINIINIDSVKNPYLRAFYNTKYDPFGLDIDSTRLYVCHGEKGIIIYDLNKLLNKDSIPEIGAISGITAYDAIFYNNILYVVGENGFYQYDYSDFNHIKQISSILAGQ